MAKRPSDCGESSSHDNTKELPTSRRHRKSWVGVQCPICGLTLREGQVKQHYDAEVAKLGELHKKKQKKKSKTHNRLSEGDGDVVNKTALNRAKEVCVRVCVCVCDVYSMPIKNLHLFFTYTSTNTLTHIFIV